MKARIRPLAEINREAEAILIREMGVASAMRFLSQFRAGSGDYTKERGQWLDDLSLGQIASAIKDRAKHEFGEMTMGLTHITVKISALADKSATPFEAEFLVDTGSIDCLAPAEKLRAAGVHPEGKRVYELANRQPVEYEYGFARVAFFGDETVAQVIFGPPNVEPILGVVALENTGVVIDPVTRDLKRLPAKPLK
jgi:predicted aspartyl protease